VALPALGLAAAGLAGALLGDRQIAACAAESGKTAPAYVAGAFSLRNITLRGGERLTVAVASDPCLAFGQSTRILIYQRTARGYRRVLDAVTIPGLESVNRDGSVVLPTHESTQVVYESAYVWNGARFIFSMAGTTRYDVSLGRRRPAEVRVRFSPGSYGTTLRGSAAINFGDDYVFNARAGQHVSIALGQHSGPAPAITFWLGERQPVTVIGGIWQGTLRRTGDYRIGVEGSGDDDTVETHYALSLSIR